MKKTVKIAACTALCMISLYFAVILTASGIWYERRTNAWTKYYLQERTCDVIVAKAWAGFPVRVSFPKNVTMQERERLAQQYMAKIPSNHICRSDLRAKRKRLETEDNQLPWYYRQMKWWDKTFTPRNKTPEFTWENQ